MSFHDLENALGMDYDEFLGDEELRRVDAMNRKRPRRQSPTPQPDDLGWYPLGSGPGGWA